MLSKRVAAVACLAFVRALTLCGPACAQETPCPSTEFLYDYPRDAGEIDWSEQVQGLAHDDGHWIVNRDLWIYKIPVATDLNDTEPEPAFLAVGMPVRLLLAGYDHFGDPDRVDEFLFVPIEGESNPTPAIAVFRAQDLSFVGIKLLVDPDQEWAPWVAYDPHDKLLYSSHNYVDPEFPLYRYTIDLGALRRTDPKENPKNDEFVEASITFLDRFPLHEADGSPLAPRLGGYMQGAAFTPWGDLYLVNGQTETADVNRRAGIHVFNLRPEPNPQRGRLITDSHNPTLLSVNPPLVLDPIGTFPYAFDPRGSFGSGEEPEGADWWDLDDGPFSPAPSLPDGRVGGQLHVLLLDNDAFDDNVWLKHYRVDGSCVPATPPVADSGLDQTVECSAYGGAQVTLDGMGSSSSSGTLDYFWSAPNVVFDDPTSPTPTAQVLLGETTATLVVSNGAQESSDTVLIRVRDSIAPKLSVELRPRVLAFPLHQLALVRASVRVEDICDAAPRFVLSALTSDEPDDAPGPWDGHTVGDIRGAEVGTADLFFWLRAERSLVGDGRTYTSRYTASDASGNRSEVAADVRVPVPWWLIWPF